MGSIASLELNKLNAKGKVVQVGTDTPVAIRLKYIGSGSVTTAPTVTTATKIEWVTTDGLTDTYLFGSGAGEYNTVGALVDAINADGIFEAKVLDSLRSKPTVSQFVDGLIAAGTVDGVRVWDVLVDTNAAFYFAVCVTADRGFSWPSATKKGHVVKLKQARYSVTMGTAAVDSFQIFERNGSTEEKIYSALSVKTTDTTEVNLIGDDGAFLSTPNELVIIVKDAAALADAPGNFLRAIYRVE